MVSFGVLAQVDYRCPLTSADGVSFTESARNIGELYDVTSKRVIIVSHCMAQTVHSMHCWRWL